MSRRSLSSRHLLTSHALRRGALFALLASVALLAAPRVARLPVPVVDDAASTVEAIATAVQAPQMIEASVAHDGPHLGFDTNIYPGDRAMAAWIDGGSPYEWVGYYLRAACHRDGSWSGKRERLETMGWGTAVIYVGQQSWPKRSGRARAGRRCSTAYLSASRGALDAIDAISRAGQEGFPDGTVIFLDIERMETIPKVMRDYYRAWTGTMLAAGRYRPGIYAHEHNAKTIYADVRGEFVRAGATFDPPFWLAGNSKRFGTTKDPGEIGHVFTDVWQGLLDVVRTHNGHRLPIDVNVAANPSPSSHRNEFLPLQ